MEFFEWNSFCSPCNALFWEVFTCLLSTQQLSFCPRAAEVPGETPGGGTVRLVPTEGQHGWMLKSRTLEPRSLVYDPALPLGQNRTFLEFSLSFGKRGHSSVSGRIVYQIR